MKNQLWGYIRYLLLGVITATALLWSITVVPAAASSLRHPELDSGSLAQIPGQARNDVDKGLVLSLPFAVDSHWTSVDNQTPGIVWQSSPPLTPPPTGGELNSASLTKKEIQASSSPAKGRLGGDSIKFGIQDGQFVPGDLQNDTWFIYGWFGALSAIKESYNVKYPEWNDRHDGIDFAGKEGIEVTSASTGTVIFAGKKIGNTVIVNAGNGYQITYAHLQNISVKKGQRLKVDDLIGHLGHTGTVNPHLHFEVDLIKKVSRTAINPVPLFKAEWGSVVIPNAEANQFYTDDQNPFTQPDFNW